VAHGIRAIKTGTIFEDSPLGLDKWLCAMWQIVNDRNGISSWEIHRALGVSQKTAWFMDHRIRHALQNGSILRMGQEGGPVEADECFPGGKPKNMHAKRRAKLQAHGDKVPKPVVFGLFDRETRQVRTKILPNVRREALMNEILDQVVLGSKVFTDAHKGYDGLLLKGYMHQFVSHMNEYVRGEVHTNSLENFWSLLKRGLTGTYIAVEPFHLSRYLDEQVFRFNHRKLTDSERFDRAVRQIVGKRITWDRLTGKEEGTQPEPF